ncbi:MAG: hypothetical protein Q4A88_03830 [Clostridia bacterium]|nr:hypothetical protein [Clostridia bacterium]
MSSFFLNQPNGYLETIQKGIHALRGFERAISYGTGSRRENLVRLRKELTEADAVVIGAGAGLSTSAGFVYDGERFERYFFDFIRKYGFRDMYSGGFGPFASEEERWAYWARYIYINRYMDIPKPVYSQLFDLVREKDYFVITTNVDHCFQRAGFDKKRLFYTQGDFGLFQSVDPGNGKTYENEAWVLQAMEAQGFAKDENGFFCVPENKTLRMELPKELVPKCPDDGSDMTTNLRADDSFVEDEGWHRASAAYSEYLHSHQNRHVLYLEIGVGMNTPVIIKYPFWALTAENPNAVYACLNFHEAFCPKQIENRSICIDGDTGEVLAALAAMQKEA